MLKITVTEKGGGEQQFFFEESEEVAIGRLQTNRIVLPKPNVSKRHAVLEVREGRVVIRDTGSTNGTYVNGRRIAGSRELGPQDRVYIGDFTIRARLVESRDERSEPEILPPAPPPAPAEEQQRATIAMPALPPIEELSAEEPIPLDLDVEVVEEPGPADQVAAPAGSPPIVEPSPRVEPVSAVEEPGPDRVPTALPRDDLMAPTAGPSHFEPMFSAAPGPTARAPAATQESADTAGCAWLRVAAERAAAEVFHEIPADQSEFSDEEWQALSDRVLQLVDRLRREDALPADVDAFQTVQDILDDFGGLGPLEELLQDPTVRRVLVDGTDRILLTRGGRSELYRRPLSGPDALSRILAKLERLIQTPLQPGRTALEGTLPDGTHLVVLFPPLSERHPIVMLHRPVGSLLAPEDLVRSGVMDDASLREIERAVRERLNVFVCGAPDTGKLTFLNAIARLLAPENRVVVIERFNELSLGSLQAIRLSKDHLACVEGPSGLCLVNRLVPDAVVISELEAEDARLLTALALNGQRGILASMTAASPDACLRRLELLIGYANPALDATMVRAFVQNLVDRVVVIGLDDRGRARVSDLVAVEHGEARRIAP